MKANRFQTGTGRYTCRICGRSTRATGRGDNEHIELCAQCYDLGGIENAISDGIHTKDDIQEAARLIAEIKGKGGTPVFDYMDLLP